MEDLYHELWGNQSPRITDFTVPVPEVQYSPLPGFGIGLHPDEVNQFLPPKVLASTEHVFNVLRVNSILPCGRNRLLVRKQFEIIESHLQHAASTKWNNTDPSTGDPQCGTNLDYKVSGQPGIGKSYFLSYLLARRLQMCQPTVYRRSDDQCFLFDEGTAGQEVSASILFQLTEDKKREIWILTDSIMCNPSWLLWDHSWFVVMGSLPAKVNQSTRWEKGRNSAVYYVDNWKWGEILAGFSPSWLTKRVENRIAYARHPTPNEVVKLYTMFVCLGPVARTCLEIIATDSQSNYNDSLRVYLGQIDREIYHFISSGGLSIMDDSVNQESSHKISLMVPSADSRTCTTQITTRWIAHKIFEVAHQQSQRDCFQLYKYLSSQPQLRSAASWFFEGYAHDWLGHGGYFSADKLPILDKPSSILEFRIVGSQSAPLNYFTTPADLAKQVCGEGHHGIKVGVIGKYFLPRSCNNESLDGLAFSHSDTLILFQMTLAKSHSIKPAGVKDLLDLLPNTISNIQLVFVVPHERIGSYTSLQTVLSPDSVRPQGPPVTIEQFRLSFTEDMMKATVVNGPFVSHPKAQFIGGCTSDDDTKHSPLPGIN
ncbi:unnamed protein product [Tuber aestivum]|uniref:Uncharacterized protein n=1 Tax=Tuber aestivum TaxID=59557 RepID=A0A292PRS0_9PEZI|nr:unnamed protein product [Tuber aestivum]